MKKLLASFAFLMVISGAQAATPEKAYFAGGCFWCTESDFEKLPGVLGAVSGYTGGKTAQPSYEYVSAGGTGHAESVEVTFDPAKVSYPQLLDYFWHHVDPTDPNGQFCDKGTQYRSAIFYRDEEQHRAAEESKKKIEQSGVLKKPVVTQVVAAGPFYPAEEYHQDYYKKNPLRYGYYRHGCGRDKRLVEVWGAAAPKH